MVHDVIEPSDCIMVHDVIELFDCIMAHDVMEPRIVLGSDVVNL